jgi:DNA uptake protein ComE-like DNA-binding protein
MTMNRTLALTALFLAACGGAGDLTGGSSAALQLPPADAARVLAFVNYPGTDVAVLDEQVGLDSRAAQNIVTRRDGADGVTPSADDVPFATLADLDAISYVGDAALQKLQAYSLANPAPAGETVEGVSFAGWESQAVVYGVNLSSPTDLDALLDSRAVAGLVARRPFTSVTAMGPVSYVGASALEKLRVEAPAWWAALRGAAGLAGTFDSVTFDDATAKVALAIADQATSAELTGHGVTATPAARILAGRPFTTLAQVAALSGVGTATMNALHAYAASGQWSAPADCVASFENAVGPYLPDLLFLSESDRPFDLVSFPGQGTTAPTGASLLVLLGEPAGVTAESRDPNNYYVDFEPSGAGSTPNAGALVQAAIAAQLTDVIYIAVHQPAGSLYQADVDVYLVGRTACGDLVGLHAISIET